VIVISGLNPVNGFLWAISCDLVVAIESVIFCVQGPALA